MLGYVRRLNAIATVLLLTASGAAAADIVTGGTLSAGTTVFSAPDTYHVTSSLIVPPGAELVIEPGATLRFGPGAGLRVEGTLTARGTAAARIVFTSAGETPAPGSWGFPLGPGDVMNGIAFVDAVGSVLEYTLVEYGTGVSIVRSAPVIAHNIMRFNRPHGSAVLFFNGMSPFPSPVEREPVVADNRIEDSTEYGFNVQQGSIQFVRNLVQRTRGGFIGGIRGAFADNAIACNGSGSPLAGMLNDTAVLVAFANTARFAGNSFLDNTPYDVVMRFDAQPLDLTGSYWGTTELNAIAARVYDVADAAGTPPFLNPPVSPVYFNPPLATPSPTAPIADACSSAPVAVDDHYSMLAGNTLTVIFPGVLNNDTAPLDAVVEFTPPAIGTFAALDRGGFSFTPPPDFSGTVYIPYVIRSSSGDSNMATLSITVTTLNPPPLPPPPPPPPADEAAPIITAIAADPSVVWPVNHKMVAVRVQVTAIDNVDGNPTCSITGISGGAAADWQITGALTALVRAERSGRDGARVYTIAVRCEDDADNAASAAVTVTVPHDQR